MIDDLLKRLTDTDRERARRQIYRECRRCGTSLRSDDNRCTVCGSTEISRHVIGEGR